MLNVRFGNGNFREQVAYSVRQKVQGEQVGTGWLGQPKYATVMGNVGVTIQNALNNINNASGAYDSSAVYCAQELAAIMVKGFELQHQASERQHQDMVNLTAAIQGKK